MSVESACSREENERKYRLIKRAIDECKGDQVIVMGDMNGHIGMLEEPINRNGDLLLEFMEENRLENLNVTVAEGRVTWMSKETKSAIDYILVNEKVRKHVKSMWIDEEGQIDSDHNMLVMD